MRTEVIAGQEPEVETQIRDVSLARSCAVPTGTADTVTAVFGPSDSRQKELRDGFRGATHATKMRTYAERRETSKTIASTE